MPDFALRCQNPARSGKLKRFIDSGMSQKEKKMDLERVCRKGSRKKEEHGGPDVY
ncbi:MAG: hypothetical protein J5U17_05950 [Candidatus Methanoperedens sp.]|nr:hypothetical protein [Candidatus Methanoperedens sp.]